ncbi:MAG: type 4a pilus biogenesis protein PilO [Candidatus Zapsychrus exili]|nr:type 4a pilus biogenesis protein PilO [Candidatus Zapsychrus exili]
MNLEKIKNFINKLNNIKIEDFKNIDVEQLKNINIYQIKDFILSRPNEAIKVFFVMLSIIILISIRSGHVKETRTLRENTIQMADILTYVEEYKVLQKEYNDFMKSFPKSIPSYQLLNKLSELAQSRGIKILDFSPAAEEDKKLWQLATVDISIESKDYKSIILFMQDIEDPKHAMRVDTWTGEMPSEQTEGAAKNLLKAKITIGAIKLKNE